MATTTVFGTGGWDPLTSYGEGMMNLNFAGKSASKYLKKQYQYARLYALNSPSWTVQGLRNANLNPILAATDGAFSSPTVPSVSAPDVSSRSANVVDPSVLVGMINQTKQTKSQVELQRAQAFKTFVEGLNDLKTNGFKSSSLADISNLASSLGFRDSQIQSILKAYGFDNLSASNSSGPSNPSSVTKTRHHPLDTLPVNKPVTDYLSPSERKSFNVLVDKYGYDKALSIFSGAIDEASHRKRVNDAFRRTRSRGHRVSPIYTR